jgi:hypothetical protein
MSTFTLAGDSYTITLTKPESVDNSLNNDIVLFDFWSNNLDTSFEGIATQHIEIRGTEVIDANSFTDFANINTMMEQHENITISGLGDCMDGVYVILNFSVNSIKGTPLGVEWSLSLELVRD